MSPSTWTQAEELEYPELDRALVDELPRWSGRRHEGDLAAAWEAPNQLGVLSRRFVRLEANNHGRYRAQMVDSHDGNVVAEAYADGVGAASVGTSLVRLALKLAREERF